MNLISKPARTLLFFAFFTILGIFSCKKENSDASSGDQYNASLAAAESNAEAEFVFNDVFDNVMGVNNDVGMQGTGVFGRLMSNNGQNERPLACFTVDIKELAAPATFPLQITIDFGPGCEGKDGHTRKGKIIARYTGRLITPGKSASVTFEGFAIDSILVEGTETISNTSVTGNRQFTIDVSNARLSKSNGNYIAWNNHKIITQTDGLNTPDFALDDVFTIEGNSSGQLKSQTLLATWQSEIESPLVKKFLCRWIVEGKIKTTLGASSANNQWTAELDFGSGACDGKATITINGSTQEISLH
ncbi:MAG: hypothetical protein JST09_17410 [Bacteroidetes bacterium]|nr:hypothetical protein [Bacteroidota bacterium]